MISVETDTDTNLVTIVYDDTQVDVLGLEYALENAISLGYYDYDFGVSHINITPEQALDLYFTGRLTVVDVREAAEFISGHIPDAIMSPWTSQVFQNEYEKLLPGHEFILFACQTGSRSGEAARYAYSNYFMWSEYSEYFPRYDRYKRATVYSLVGGMDEWMAAGYETSTDPYVPPPEPDPDPPSIFDPTNIPPPPIENESKILGVLATMNLLLK